MISDIFLYTSAFFQAFILTLSVNHTNNKLDSGSQRALFNDCDFGAQIQFKVSKIFDW